MAIRSEDNWSIYDYPLVQSTQDRRSHPSKVPYGNLVRARGIDGRFNGSARVFPGFNKVLDLTAAPFDGSTDYWKNLGTASSNPYFYLPDVDNINLSSNPDRIYFFKYMTVQVPEFTINARSQIGESRVLRGWVVAHQYATVPSRGVLRYYYWDPVEEVMAYFDLLKEVTDIDTILGRDGATGSDAEWPFSTFYVTKGTNSAFHSTTTFDVGSQGSFIYFCVTPAAGRDAAFTQYHRSVWINGLGVDTPNSTSDQIDLNCHWRWYPSIIGPANTRLSIEAAALGTATIQGIYTTTTDSITAVNRVDDTGGAGNVQDISTGFRFMLLTKNTEGPYQGELDLSVTAPAALNIDHDLTVTAYEAAGGGTYYRRKLPVHMLRPRFRVYRSLDNSIFTSTNGQSFILGGTVFRENSTELADNITDPKNYPNVVLSALTDPLDDGSPDAKKVAYAGNRTDEILVRQIQYDPNETSFTFSPRGIRLLQPYQGTLLRVGTVPYPTVDLDVSDRTEVLSWGALTKFAPEQFRVEDSTPLGASQDETTLAMVPAGDYVFVVGDSSVFRIHRNGNLLAINEIQTLAGGVGRFAAVGVGTTMFYVNPNGLYLVDGATGDFQLVSALDRVIQDDWRDTLTSIQLGYDQVLGTTLMLNTDLEQAILLWNNTGNITQLEDVPFVFTTEGVHPREANTTFSRSYWITDEGIIYSPNADGTGLSITDDTQDAISLCGGDSTKVWNGYVDVSATNALVSASTCVITRPDTDETLVDHAAVGFYLYVFSGANEGKYLITAMADVGGDTRIGIDGTFPGGATWTGADSDHRVCVAPIIFEPLGWPLQERDGADVFARKQIKALAHATDLLSGDTTTTTNVNLKMEFRIYYREDLDTPVATGTKDISADQSQNYLYKNIAGSRLFPAWRVYASNVDFEMIEGLVHAIQGVSEAESKPVG